MAKKNDTIEVTEKSKAPFRLFNNIEYCDVTVPEEWGNAVFSVRPMTNTERAVFDSEEDELKKSRDFRGAIKRSGLKKEDLYSADKEDAEKIAENWNLVVSETKYSPEHESHFLEVCKDKIVACTKTVTISGVTHDFNSDMYEQMNGDNVRLWLLNKIRGAGEVKDEEVLSL